MMLWSKCLLPTHTIITINPIKKEFPMEIERKFLIDKIPGNIDLAALRCRHIEQGYLCAEPVVRVRRDNDDYYLTYKSKGRMAREEYNLPLTKTAYDNLIKKADGNIITKTRYEIPEKDNLTIELDIFEGRFAGLLLAEVEFSSEAEALAYVPPVWFGKDVTNDATYHNSNMACRA